jgi:stalled ribosome rescue protein Dom34
MAYAVLWLDNQEAKIFKFVPGNVSKADLKRSAAEHAGATDHHYFGRVADAVKDSNEVLVVGPGMAKKHFMSHLENHSHNNLLKKVVGVENMDHPTDNQIVAEARKFFRAHDLFESI